jgi:NAD(P)-dependent dehydrogenase (short-subunit alcohol dehydrogenase family)
MADPVQFEPQHLEAFVRLSHDRNPLHCDAEYARRTPHGRVVLHGMAAVLTLLGRWAGGRRLALSTLRCRFLKPVYLGEPYAVQTTERGDEVTLKLLKGQSARAEVKFRFTAVSEHPRRTAQPFEPLREAADVALDAVGPLGRVPYACGDDGAFFQLAGVLAPSQLDALAGASYLVGMVSPGRQALFSELELELGAPSAEPFSFDIPSVELDARFNQFRLSGAGVGLQKFVATAFRRPLPLDPSEQELREAFASLGKPFAGKVALVTGASRGFGAALAQGLALGGARLLLHHASGGAAAEKVRAQLAAMGAEAAVLRADLTRADDCARLAKQAGALDLLVQSAAGPIEAEAFFDQSADEFLAQLQRATTLDLRALHALVPWVKPEGICLYVSSAFTQTPEPRFAHYVAAKSATEGLIRALSAELKAPRFAIVRPPRMLTDQTNLPYQRAAPASALTIARGVLERLAEIPADQRLTEL